MNLRDSLGAMASLLCCLQVACAEQPHSDPPPTSEPHPLQGYWEGDGDSGEVSMTVAGNSLYFYARPDFQYDTTFELVPGTDPLELHATILDSPRTTDSVGEVVIAIYEFENGALNLAAVDKSEGASFEKAISRYRLERAQAPEEVGLSPRRLTRRATPVTVSSRAWPMRSRSRASLRSRFPK